MEDFLRDSLGIVEENAVLQVASEEVCNVSFTSALASIEEEEANDDEETALLQPGAIDVLVSKTELPPSVQKLEAQKAALLKLGLEIPLSQKKEKLEIAEAGTQDLVSPEVEEEPSGRLDGVMEVEEKEEVDKTEEETEIEVQGDLHESLDFRREVNMLDGLKESVGELKSKEGEGGDLDILAVSENTNSNLLGEECDHTTGSTEVEGGFGNSNGGLGGNVEQPNAGSKDAEQDCKNNSYDSGLSKTRSNDVSLVENEQEGKLAEEKNAVVSDEKPIVEKELGSNSKVNVPGESFTNETAEKNSGDAVTKDQSESNEVQLDAMKCNLTLKVEAFSSTASPPLSVDAVTEDFAWFDCPGLMVTEVDGGLQVVVGDKQLGIAAMEGLKHKYSITQQVLNLFLYYLTTGIFQVPIVADPSTGLYTLTFTDSKLMRYTATRQHFLKFCKVGEQLVLSRGTGKQEVLVSFESREAAVEAMESTLGDENFPGVAVVSACRP